MTLGVSGDFFLSTNNGSANWSLGSYAEIGKEIGTIGEGGNIGKIAVSGGFLLLPFLLFCIICDGQLAFDILTSIISLINNGDVTYHQVLTIPRISLSPHTSPTQWQ